MWAGDWRRAYDYGDPQGEALAVHESGRAHRRLDAGQAHRPRPGGRRVPRPPLPQPLREPQARAHPLRRADLRRRADHGRRHRSAASTTRASTSPRPRAAPGAVEQWFSWWLADWRMEVALTDVTQGLAAVNLAGPARPRDHGPPHRPGLLQRGLRLPRRQARAGRRRALPASCASASSARSATRSTSPPPTARTCGTRSSRPAPSTGIRPFGLEPQRILRLQKLHILVGQDTDSESTPYGAAMPWIVKLDKDEDFIGKWALEHAAEHPAPRPRSSASRCPTATSRPRAPRCSTRAASRSARSRARATRASSGRSSAWRGCRPRWPATAPRSRSPTTAGTLRAEVLTRPFYDPDGEVLRS